MQSATNSFKTKRQLFILFILEENNNRDVDVIANAEHLMRRSVLSVFVFILQTTIGAAYLLSGYANWGKHSSNT